MEDFRFEKLDILKEVFKFQICYLIFLIKLMRKTIQICGAVKSSRNEYFK